MAWLCHLTIDHASLSTRSTVPTPNRDTCNILRAHHDFYIYYIETVCLSYLIPVSLFVATIYLLGWRYFSRYSLVYQSPLCYICLFSPSPLTRPLPPCLFRILLLCEYHSVVLCHTGTYLHPRRPPEDWYMFLFFLVGPGPLHEIRNAVSAFSRSPLGRANMFSSQYLGSALRIYFKCFSSLTLFLTSSVPLSSILVSRVSCTRQASLWTVPLLGLCIFPCMLS